MIDAVKRWWRRVRDTEPARWAEVVRAVIVAGVALNWFVVDDQQLNLIISAFGVVWSWMLTGRTRDAVFSRDTVEQLLRLVQAGVPVDLDHVDALKRSAAAGPKHAVDHVVDPAADDPVGPPVPRHTTDG